MVLSFTDYMGYILSYTHELLNLTVFTVSLNGADTHISFGSVILFCAVIPVMYKLLFPSPS